MHLPEAPGVTLNVLSGRVRQVGTSEATAVPSAGYLPATRAGRPHEV